MFDSIVSRGHYSESDAASLVRTMVRVVGHCHAMGVIHRDLKPENFLFSSRGSDAELKCTDFGLSVFFSEGQRFSDILGSAFYVAPEVLRRSYGPHVTPLSRVPLSICPCCSRLIFGVVVSFFIFYFVACLHSGEKLRIRSLMPSKRDSWIFQKTLGHPFPMQPRTVSGACWI